MIVVAQKKTVFLLLAFIFMGGVSASAITLGLHPNMNNWKKEAIVITDVKTDKKVVALTFDDGPDPVNTPLLLDVLKKHDAKATFFLLGIKVEKNPDLVKRMSDEKHELGNHSYSHADFNRHDDDFVRAEIQRGNAAVKKITGKKPHLFRPPGGYLSYKMVDMIREEKQIIAYWTYQQDSKDWRNIKASRIADHIISNLKPGQIIILHDGTSNGSETVKAVDLLIPRLYEEGYRLVTVSELISMEKRE